MFLGIIYVTYIICIMLFVNLYNPIKFTLKKTPVLSNLLLVSRGSYQKLSSHKLHKDTQTQNKYSWIIYKLISIEDRTPETPVSGFGVTSNTRLSVAVKACVILK